MTTSNFYRSLLDYKFNNFHIKIISNLKLKGNSVPYGRGRPQKFSQGGRKQAPSNGTWFVFILFHKFNVESGCNCIISDWHSVNRVRGNKFKKTPIRTKKDPTHGRNSPRPRAYLIKGGGFNPPPKFSEFFWKSEGKEIERKRKKGICWGGGGGGYLLTYFWGGIFSSGVEIFSGGLRYFQGGWEIFGGYHWEISGGVEKFSWGVEKFSGGGVEKFSGGRVEKFPGGEGWEIFRGGGGWEIFGGGGWEIFGGGGGWKFFWEGGLRN